MPERGSGPGGRVMSKDLKPLAPVTPAVEVVTKAETQREVGEVEVIKLALSLIHISEPTRPY